MHCGIPVAGVVLNATHEGPDVEQTVLNIDVTDSPDYFKPGLPYHGKVGGSLYWNLPLDIIIYVEQEAI